MMLSKDKIFKVLFIVGLIVLGTAVFLDSFKVASLSTLKSGGKRIQFELNEKYTTIAPEYPLDESNYILAPIAPEKDATKEQKDAYEKTKAEFDGKVKGLKAKYDEDVKIYNQKYKEYLRNQRVLDLDRQKNASGVKKTTDKLAKDIEMRQLSINEFIFSTILRYIGSMVLLIGSLGILLFGETYEKLGVLIVIGFGLKTIIGL